MQSAESPLFTDTGTHKYSDTLKYLVAFAQYQGVTLPQDATTIEQVLEIINQAGRKRGNPDLILSWQAKPGDSIFPSGNFSAGDHYPHFGPALDALDEVAQIETREEKDDFKDQLILAFDKIHDAQQPGLYAVRLVEASRDGYQIGMALTATQAAEKLTAGKNIIVQVHTATARQSMQIPLSLDVVEKLKGSGTRVGIVDAKARVLIIERQLGGRVSIKVDVKDMRPPQVLEYLKQVLVDLPQMAIERQNIATLV